MSSLCEGLVKTGRPQSARMLELKGRDCLLCVAFIQFRYFYILRLNLYMDSLLKPLNSKKASFGRHETFALRYSWLTKGFQAFKKEKSIFSSDESTIELGVGKNMVNAIKYWLRASAMVLEVEDGLVVSDLGKAIFADDGWDPYLEDEATVWLIHWQLATNAELATAWYWFFNCYHKAEFTTDDAMESLADFVRNNLNGKHSERTVKQEVAMILRMYCPFKSNSKSIEESLDSPLASLKLVSAIEDQHVYRSYGNLQSSLPIELIGYAANEIFNQRQIEYLPIADLMYGPKNGIALGSIFRLTESALLAKLENLVKAYPNIFQINETAGVNQLYRQDSTTESLTFLRHYYQPTR
jgi:hypothetical protein